MQTRQLAYGTGFLIFSLAAVIAAEPAKTTPPAATSPSVTAATTSIVHGTATIELKKGTVQFLNGLGIAVVPENAYNEIKKIRNERWLLRASRGNFDDGFHNLDMDAIGGTAVAKAVTTAKADEKGKFEIKGLVPGSYRLYAQYKSHYAVAYWLVPVVIKDARQELTVNINSANMEEAFNLFK